MPTIVCAAHARIAKSVRRASPGAWFILFFFFFFIKVISFHFKYSPQTKKSGLAPAWREEPGAGAGDDPALALVGGAEDGQRALVRRGFRAVADSGLRGVVVGERGVGRVGRVGLVVSVGGVAASLAGAVLRRRLGFGQEPAYQLTGIYIEDSGLRYVSSDRFGPLGTVPNTLHRHLAQTTRLQPTLNNNNNNNNKTELQIATVERTLPFRPKVRCCLRSSRNAPPADASDVAFTSTAAPILTGIDVLFSFSPRELLVERFPLVSDSRSRSREKRVPTYSKTRLRYGSLQTTLHMYRTLESLAYATSTNPLSKHHA